MLTEIQFPHSLPGPLHVVLASSGGADSLGALTWLHDQHQKGLINEITVVSIDHQLHPDSSEWSARAKAQANYFSIESHIVPIKVPARGIHGQHSLESRARWSRYEALKLWLQDKFKAGEVPVLVTAHHLEDQVETFLLAALRGSGAAGLSAMPTLTQFGIGFHWRPFLGTSRESLRQWASSLPLIPVDDPSNQDLSYDRNYLRAEILPRLHDRWAQGLAGIGQSAAQSAEDQALLESLAEVDGAPIGQERLSLRSFVDLPPPRQSNLLRTWIKRHGALMPPKARLNEFLRQLETADANHHPELTWSEWTICRYRDELWWRATSDSPIASDAFWTDKTDPIEVKPGEYIHLVPTEEADPLAIGERWLNKDWRLRARQPGDRIQPKGSSHSRSLKNWFQERGCPPWVRTSTPIVEIENKLACLVGWAVDRDFAPAAGETSWRIEATEPQV